MKSEDVLRYLALAEIHVADGQRQIARQKALIEQMEQDGEETTACRALLDMLIQSQVEQCADRDDLIRDVVRLRKQDDSHVTNEDY
jgi:hypothetical protein